MAYCPRCGAPTQPSMAFCTSCGERLAAGIVAPAPTPAPAPGAGPGPGRVGTKRDPIVAIVLAIVTLGIYGLYYWWVASREIDEHSGRPGHSHNLVRIGTIVSIVGGVVFFIAIVSFVGALIAAGVSAREPPAEEIVGIVFGMIGVFLLAGAASFAGAIMRVIGKYRMWQLIEEDERRRSLVAPLSAGLMLALTIIGWFVSPFGWALALVVLYMTIDHLNQRWSSAAA